MKLFLEELRARVEQRRADGKGLALLFIECGIIGRIDAVWGYAAGDAVREHFCSRLKSGVLRDQDLLGEIGRDGIACVLDAVQSLGVAQLAAEKMLGTLDTPVLAGEDEIYARPAIGVALFPLHGDSEVTLLQHARTACRDARERAERVVVYAEEREKPVLEKLRAESHLRGAIISEALELVFLPQHEFRTGLISGVETLLCLRDGALRIVSARKAIESAQWAGLENELTGRMLNAAMRNCADFRDTGGLNLRIGVNLSAQSLHQRGLPEVISRALDTWNLRAGRLVIEIDEMPALEASPEAISTLRRLKEIGARLCVDDPGVGFASFAWLATMPFDEMKIDLSLVPEMLKLPKQQALVQSMVELAHRLKLEVVADGVADAAMAASVKELGCDYMQGNHVSPPLDQATLIRNFGR